MAEIAVTTLLNGALVNALANAPQITITRLDTDADVVSGAAMTDTGANGKYRFSFTPVAGLQYGFLIDADPLNNGQVDIRYFDGAFDNEVNDIWNDRGLNPSINKTITENTAGSDYDEQVLSPTQIDKSVVKAGSVTTINRS